MDAAEERRISQKLRRWVCYLFALPVLLLNASAQSPYTASHEPAGPSSRKTPIAISEIMYKPAPRADGLNLEYIEIYNSNPFFHDIGNYRVIGNNMSYTFPAGTVIPALSYFVIAAAPADVKSVYGLGTNVFGPYSGSLKKSDKLQLLDEVGAVLLTISYSSDTPWPLAADGTGHSLILSDPTYGEGDARAWDVSELPGGSPGQPEPAHAQRSVCLNEVKASTQNQTGFVELYNHGSTALDISGFILTGDGATNRFVLPPGSSLEAGNFLAFSEHDIGFTILPGGGRLFLSSADGQKVLDVVQYLPQANDRSFGRYPDGGPEFCPLAAGSAGAGNGPIYDSAIVINELMYDPISGDDDEQYIELYNKGTSTVDLSGWSFTSGVNFKFGKGVSLAPDGYLVVARNVANLLGRYSNLTITNTVGPFDGSLSHSGDHVALARPVPVVASNGAVLVTNTVYAIEDEVTYQSGGCWGQWAAGGGSSLELRDPRSNRRLAGNWADSDESAKSAWTTIEATGVLDNGANYESSIAHAQLGLQDVGECLVDNVEVIAGSGGNNLILNSDFESGLANWSLQGCFSRSSIENSGFQSAHSLHVRSSDRVWTGDNSCQAALAGNSLSAGQTATLRFRARWLHGWPEALLRLNGNWLEATGRLPVPTNLGTPGARNSQSVTNSGPAIYDVRHTPSLPSVGQSVLVTARVDDPDGLGEVMVKYRIDPSTAYLSLPMNDSGTDGDAVANDGIYSALIPGQPAARTIVAFYLSATDSGGAVTRFPALRNDNAPDPECLVMIGEPTPAGSFGVYHFWVTQTNVTRWHNLSDLSNESHDITFVNGDRIIYNAQARFAGSPYHQQFDTPYGNLCHYKLTFQDDDKFLGATSFNKIHQPGNGAGDDTTIQREQLANLFLRTLGVPWLNRRYVAVYVNGRRRGTLMEDAQTPDGDVIKERFPNDSNGYLYKMQPWFEFTPAVSIPEMGFNNMSWCTLMPFTTSGGVKKTARYRYNYLVRRTPDSANNYAPVFALIDAANSFGSSNYVASMEAVADMENWMRVFAANHAAGNWDSFGAQNEQNLYGYIGTKEARYSLLMWDFNIVFGNSGSWQPGQNLFTVNSSDSSTANIYQEPAFRRMYWRALKELVNGPLDVAKSGPLLDAKFAAFSSSGVSVTSPSTIKTWITSARSSIASQISAEDTTSFSANPPVVSGNVALLSGTAPIAVKTIQVNGTEWPVRWTGVTQWQIEIPLPAGTSVLNLAGVDIHGDNITGASATVSATITGAAPDPGGAIVINEIMKDPAVPGAQYIELYNNSSFGYDLSGCSLTGVSYIFPPGSFLAGDSYFVLAAGNLPFAEAYGAAAPVFDVFSGALPVDGELKLVRPQSQGGGIVSEVNYQSTAPWPAPVPGSALQLIDATAGSERVGNWQLVTSNAVAPKPEWKYVTLTGKATKSTLLIGLTTDGDAYVDDLKLVAGTVPEAGENMIVNGDFESTLTGPWTVSANMANSEITADVQHSGTASLHVSATSGGPLISEAIWQTTKTLTTNATYTLSYWYLPGSHASSFLIRLSGSSPNAGHIYSLTPFELPSAVTPRYTPGLPNSVARALPAFPNVWINEIQPAPAKEPGSLGAWIELFNTGTSPVDLTSLYLTDNYSNLLQSPFPSGSSIAPGEFKLVFTDGRTNLSNANQLHTGFILQPAGGSVALSRVVEGQPQVVDYVDYPAVPSGVSYGSIPDGQGNERSLLARPSPGQSNSGGLANPGVVINEWMAANTRTLKNPLTDSADDWFELYNSSAGAIDLSGYYLSDTLTNRQKFRIGNSYVIPAGGYRLVWADKQGIVAGGDLHVNFKLNKAGGSIGLFGPNSDTIDFITFGPQSSDISQGRFPDGAESIRAMSPTPGGANVGSTNSILLLSPAEQFTYPGQTITFPLKVDGVGTNGALSFALIASSAVGAQIDASTGRFVWAVPANQVSGTNFFQASVTMGVSPPEIATASFDIIVLPLPAVTATVQTGGTVLGWPSAAGRIYRVEMTDSLVAPDWQPVGADWNGTGAPLELKLDTSLATERFFRIVITQ